MRDIRISRQFHHFRIDHDELNVIWRGFINNTHDQRIDANGFTGTRRACHEHVRHFRNIGNDRFSSDVLPHGK